jgi:hypothetical protein
MSAPQPDLPALPSVALVVPWFGPLPSWFDVWLRSCAGNPSIDWLLFTDQPLADRPIPPNVRHVPIDFGTLRRLFCDRLEMDVCLTVPYQLCNFKLAYGFLFREWLSGYEIWGYCDVDVVWGDLRRFFPASLLRTYPKLQQNGHLTLFHNTEQAVQLFRQPHPHPSKDYRVVFAQPEVLGFCEWYGAHELAYLARLEQYEVHEFVDVDSDTPALRGICLHNYEHQLFYWEDGALYREYVGDPGVDPEDSAYPATQREEFAYLHLQKRLMRAPDFDVSAVRGFYITPDGFVQKVKAVHCLADFLLLNPGPVRQRSTQPGSGAASRTVRKLVRPFKRLAR